MNVDAADTIDTFMNFMMPPSGNGDARAIRVTVNASMEDFTADRDEDGVAVDATVYILFHRPFNYMGVYYATEYFAKAQDYKFAGRHDSGWRSLVGTLIRDLERSVRADFEKRWPEAKGTFQARVREVEEFVVEVEDKSLTSIRRK
jgi:hypothetical protein